MNPVLAFLRRKVRGVSYGRILLYSSAAAKLEQPDRIEHLSEAALGYAPVNARRETTAGSLGEIAHQGGAPAPKPAPTQSASLAPTGGPR